MTKRNIIFFLSLILLIGLADFALLNSQGLSAAEAKNAKVYGKKKKKKGRFKKSRHRRKRGNGPDLRALTTGSPYVENSENGINSIETTQGL